MLHQFDLNLICFFKWESVCVYLSLDNFEVEIICIWIDTLIYFGSKKAKQFFLIYIIDLTEHNERSKRMWNSISKAYKKRTDFQWVKITFSLSRICEKLTIAQLLFVSN